MYYIVEFYNDPYHIFAKCINYSSLEYSLLKTSYTFLNVAVIEKNYYNVFIDAMKIYMSYLSSPDNMYVVHNYNINGSSLDLYKILALHQGYDVNDCWNGVLVIFESSNLKNAQSLLKYLQAYINGKPSHGAVQDKFDIHLAMQMHMFMANYTSPLPAQQCITEVTRTVHLICGYEQVNFEEIFAPVGFYKAEDNSERLVYIPNASETFIDKLPIFILDIETIADNMNVVPIGSTKDQKISSLVLKVIYLNVKIYYVMYLCLDEFVSQANEFNLAFEKRYTSVEDGIYVHVSSFRSDEQLIATFVNLYSSGNILKMLTGNSVYPHIFTGHNIF